MCVPAIRSTSPSTPIPGCTWTGHVAIVSAGSDSAFSALPAENASGNWVKVVQRIPVRIAIDQKAGDPPLRAGMSAVISIDTGKRRWHRHAERLGLQMTRTTPHQPHAAHAYDSKFAEWAVLIGSMAGVLMQALDTTIANVALPYMQGSLSASRDQITWVLTSYIIAAAIMTAPVGWIAARFGKKNFLHHRARPASPSPRCCAARPSRWTQMILFRLIQGAFGAALAPLSPGGDARLYPPQKRGNDHGDLGHGRDAGPDPGPDAGRLSDRRL